ncbi:hypothetical protein CIB48_g10938, partial [Xylaria polymorpha]
MPSSVRLALGVAALLSSAQLATATSSLEEGILPSY